MTNLTFAELTALIGVNGLVVNDRYFITDKNWTIIAITTNAYRVVVPIVTEVTKAQLDALVSVSNLNEGLQYKVTDEGWLIIATSINTLESISGTLILNQGSSLPDYIKTNTLIVDTGIITATTGELSIVIPLEYAFLYADIAAYGSGVISPSKTISIASVGVQITDTIEFTGSGVIRAYVHTEGGVFNVAATNDIGAWYTNNDTDGFRCLIVLTHTLL